MFTITNFLTMWGSRLLHTFEHFETQAHSQRTGPNQGWRGQPPRGPPWVSGLVGHFVQTWPDSECSHTVQCLDCSDLKWHCNRYHLLARYDPFGVDVQLNFDNTHSLTGPNQADRYMYIIQIQTTWTNVMFVPLQTGAVDQEAYPFRRTCTQIKTYLVHNWRESEKKLHVWYQYIIYRVQFKKQILCIYLIIIWIYPGKTCKTGLENQHLGTFYSVRAQEIIMELMEILVLVTILTVQVIKFI